MGANQFFVTSNTSALTNLKTMTENEKEKESCIELTKSFSFFFSSSPPCDVVVSGKADESQPWVGFCRRIG